MRDALETKKGGSEKRRLLFIFDLDGTLITGGGSRERTNYALEKVFKIATTRKESLPHGMPETLRLVALGKLYGIKDTQVKSHIKELFAKVDEYYASHRVEKRPLKGAVELLRELRQKGYTLALATGNTSGTTLMKMEDAGISGMVDVVSNSELFEARVDIIKRAVAMASEKAGHNFGKEEIICVGDAPNDVEAARKAGLRIVSVATGDYRFEELRKLQPDYALKDLSGFGGVLNAIGDAVPTTASRDADISGKPVACVCKGRPGMSGLVERAKGISNGEEFVLLLDSESADEERLLPAYANAVIRRRDGISRSNSDAMEMLMLVSGDTHIKEAIGSVGARDLKAFIAFASSKKLLDAFIKSERLEVESWLKLELDLDAAGDVATTELLGD